MTVGERANVGSEANAEEIEGINLAASVSEAEEIDGALAVREDGLQRGFGAIVGKVPEEGIASAERQEAEGNAFLGSAGGENAVDDFVSGAVAPDRDKTPVALVVGFAREIDRMAGAGGSDHVDADAAFAQAREGWSGKFCRTAAPRSGIYDSEEAFHRCAVDLLPLQLRRVHKD